MKNFDDPRIPENINCIIFFSENVTILAEYSTALEKDKKYRNIVKEWVPLLNLFTKNIVLGIFKRLLIEYREEIIVFSYINEEDFGVMMATNIDARFGLGYLDLQKLISSFQKFKNKAKIAYGKLNTMMKEKNLKRIIVERKYLSEIFDKEVLIEDTIDTLPNLHNVVFFYFRGHDINVKIKNDIIIFEIIS